MILGIGIDLIETQRLATAIERGGERFLDRVFTPLERTDCRGRVERLAARFAAKEAVAKAFGTGIGSAMAFRDIEVRLDEAGAPKIVLHGAAQATATTRRAEHIFVSLTHTDRAAAAQVVITAAPRPVPIDSIPVPRSARHHF